MTTLAQNQITFFPYKHCNISYRMKTVRLKCEVGREKVLGKNGMTLRLTQYYYHNLFAPKE